MSTPVKLLTVVGIVVICALGTAELVQRARASARPDPPQAVAMPAPAAAAQPVDPDPPSPRTGYTAIAQRDLFRPLAKAPKSAEAPSGSGPGGPGGARRIEPAVKPLASAPGASQPADPLADLALTGVVQVGKRLQVLIENASAGTGQYVALNEEFEGFRVVLIGPSSAVLERGGKQYTLRMGSKELPVRPNAAPATSPVPSALSQSSRPESTSEGPQFRGRGGGMGGFAGDMLSWAESQSLADLERMYGQYGRYLSPQDRARAEEYLNQRRARER
jgi:hypothetical protein